MMNYKVKKNLIYFYNFVLGLLNYSIIIYFRLFWKLFYIYCWFFGCLIMLLLMNCTMYRNKILLFLFFVLCIFFLRFV